MWKKLVLVVVSCLLLLGCSSSEEKSEQAYKRALEYFENGDNAEARVEAKNAIKLNPKSADAFLLLGNCAVKDQDWRGAFGSYAQAVQLNPDLLDAQLGLGRIYLLSRQYEKAEEIVATVLEKEADNTNAHLLRAGILLQSGDLTGAQRVLQAIVAKYPNNIDAIVGLVTTYEKMGETGQAESLLSKALAANPDSLVLHYKAAALAEGQERYADAEKSYQKLLELSDNKDPIRLLIIKMYERSGQKEKAQAELEHLIAANPENTDYRLALAGLYLRSSDYDKSQKVLEDLIKDGSTDIRIELTLADILLAKQETEAAKQRLAEIAERYSEHPLSAKALAKLGTILLKEKNYSESLGFFEQAIQRDHAPEFLQLRARAKMGVGDIEGAIADLRIVRKELPDNYEARYLLARAYLAQDKGLMAVEELHDILERNAEYSPSRNLLVKYYARYGQWELAEEELQHLLDQTPDEPSLLIAMGDVKRMRGDRAAATGYYEKVLGLSEGKAPALLRLGMLAEEDRRYQDALKLYDQVLELHPESAAAIERKLFVLAASGRKKELAEYQGKLLSKLPDSPVLHDVFGRLALARRDVKGAEREFRKASELAPDWGVPYQRLIGIYLAEKDLDRVVAQCRVVLEKNPDAFVEQFLLGQIYQIKGENKLAEEAYEATLAKRPDFLPAANNLAYLYAENYSDPEMLNKALALAKKAAGKETAESLDTLGWIYHLLGNREQAIDALHKAYEGAPENKTIAYHLAYVLANWSHDSEARRILEHALADDSDFPERREMESLLKSI